MNNHSVRIRNGSRSRRRFSALQIQHWLDEFERSGLSAAAFARQHGLCYSVFCRWRKQQRDPVRRRLTASRQPRFESLPLDSLLARNWAAEIVLSGQATLRLSSQASSTWIAELLHALRRSC
jgi:transposase-like protein